MTITNTRATWLLAAVAFGIVPGAWAAQPTFAQLIAHADRADFAALQSADLSRFPPAERYLLQVRLAIGRGDLAAAGNLLDSYEKLKDKDPARLREALSRRQDLDLLAANYADAARHGEAWESTRGASDDPAFEEHQQATTIAFQLKDVPPVQVQGPVKIQWIPTTKDKVGLTRIVISINGQDQEAVIDTGASFSVVSASTAKRLGLQMLDGEASVGSTTQNAIDTRLAVAPRVVVAGTEFRSVVFLVLNDDQLEFPVPDGYKIDAILGFPELYRLGRLKFSNDTLQVQASAGTDSSRDNLMFVANKLFVAADIGGACVPLYLDTGANTSSLSSLYMRDHPEVTRALPQAQATLGGAGGTQDAAVLDWQEAPVTIGRQRVVLRSLQIHRKDPVSNLKQYGTLGRDVLEQGYSLDFPAMRLELHDATESAPGACGP